jgi:hypothetical protein
MNNDKPMIPSVSVKSAHDGRSATADALGMRPMQARVWLQRGERYLLIKSPPASGKSRALMFVALDKLRHQGLKQAIIVVPEKSIGASFHDEPLSKYGLANIARKALEGLLQKFFGSARLDLELKDRFGSQVEPREWFLVPLPVIDEAIERMKDGSISNFRYDPETARLVSR